jgi:hypothetical protein
LPYPDYSEAIPVRRLRLANLRHEAAAVLLGHLPVQGEADAGKGSNQQGGDMTHTAVFTDLATG